MANETARALRRNRTVAEQQLWKSLRDLRGQGYHFRRQVPIECFVVDFACLAQRLIIEVDGCQHDTAEGRAADVKRDSHLEWQGFRVVRFTNGDVMQNLDGVVLEVLGAIGAVAKQE